ncbi:MAG: FG-GAP repeat domain-containing protein [Planctomycetota bacterium]|jgi:hypothetical protein
MFINERGRKSKSALLLLLAFSFASLPAGCGAGVAAAVLGGGAAAAASSGTDKEYIYYHIDSPLTIEVEPIMPVVSGNVSIIFTLTDPDSNLANVSVEYSTDNGQTYWSARLVPNYGAVTNLPTSTQGVQYGVLWNTVRDLGKTNIAQARIKVRSLLVGSNVEGVSAVFAVQNNEAPSAAFQATPFGNRGGVSIFFFLTDSNSDAVDVAIEYSLSGGAFIAATPAPSSAGTTGLTSTTGGYGHLFTWDVVSQLGIGNYPDVRIRIVPWDAFDNGAEAISANFGVFLNNSPDVQVPTAPLSSREGVWIYYTLFDDDSDSLDLDIQYSFDNAAFNPMLEATGKGSEGNVSLLGLPGGAAHLFVWDYTGEFGNAGAPVVYIRLTPSDPYSTGGQTYYGPFEIDINTAPAVTVTKPSVPASGPIPINFVLLDAESDPLLAVIEFSIDAGATWTDATEFQHGATGGKTGLASANFGGVAHLFVWDSAHDLGEADYAAVRVRVTPMDDETGTPAEFEIPVLNHYRFNSPATADLGVNISTGKVDIAIGDVSGDGRPDIVAALSDEAALRVMRQSAVMSFPATDSYAGSNSFDMPVIADLNDDGLNDVVARGFVAPGNWSAVVFEQAGGTLAAAVYSSVRADISLTAGELTGDNMAEVITVDALFNVIVSSWNGSDLEVISSWPASAELAGPIYVGDFDADNGSVEILMGKYYFTQSAGIISGEFLYSDDPGRITYGTAAADFDFDGRDDVLHSYEISAGTGETVIHMNPAGGLSTSFSAAFTDWYCAGFLKTDLDADGWPDFLSAPDNFLHMNGAGAWRTVSALGTGPMGWAAGDLNGDGYDDLVSAVYDGGLTSVRLDIAAFNRTCGLLDGDFVSVGADSGNAEAMDVNGDGLTDLVVGLPSTQTGYTVLFQNPDGSLSPGIIPPPASGISHTGMRLADIDDDGRMEMIRLSLNSTGPAYEIATFEIDFSGGTTITTQYTASIVQLGELETGDVSGDGLPDAVFGGVDAAGGIFVAVNNGSGLDAPAFYSMTMAQVDFIAIGEFTGDNLNDVAAGPEAVSTFKIIPQQAGGTMSTAGVFTLDPGGVVVADLAAADVDGDMRTDLVASLGGDASIAVYLHNGTDGVTQPLIFDAGCNASSLAVGDLSGDGRDDIVITDPLTDSFTVVSHTRAGLLSAPVRFDAQHPGSPLNNFAIADLNSDGLSDIVIPQEGGNPLSVMRGRGFLATRRTKTITAAGGGTLKIHYGMPSDITGTMLDVLPGKISADTVASIRQHGDIIPAERLRGGSAVAFGPDSMPLIGNSTVSLVMKPHPNLNPADILSRGLELYRRDHATGAVTNLGNSFDYYLITEDAWLDTNTVGAYQFALDCNVLMSAEYFGRSDNTGDIMLYFLLYDNDSDFGDVTVAYSTDIGNTFRPCTCSASDPDKGMHLQASPGGTMNEFIWDSLADLPSGSAGVIVRIYPRDIEAGFAADAPSLPVDNP